MKITQLIALVRDWYEEPQTSDRVMLYLINQIEARVQKELLLQTDGIRQYDTDDIRNETELLLDETDSGVYLFYAVSMLYFRRGEYEDYQNQKAMFDDAWKRLERRLALQNHGGTSEISVYG